MISKKCKYAIKALLYLADHQSDERSVFSSEIAEKENIPKKFLETILRELRNFKLLQSQRGKKGGYRLINKNGRRPNRNATMRFTQLLLFLRRV